MSYPEYKPDTDPYNRVWQYEYDQVVQEKEILRLKLSKIKYIVHNAGRNLIAEDYVYVLRQITEVLEV